MRQTAHKPFDACYLCDHLAENGRRCTVLKIEGGRFQAPCWLLEMALRRKEREAAEFRQRAELSAWR